MTPSENIAAKLDRKLDRVVEAVQALIEFQSDSGATAADTIAALTQKVIDADAMGDFEEFSCWIDGIAD